ncbi:hypothetical protein [Phenylobacterium sp.]|uniref:hypothetical protein n=1 Tax=Phenylobacterium sp. TaxID=1871053 RepID=UPI002F93D527
MSDLQPHPKPGEPGRPASREYRRIEEAAVRPGTAEAAARARRGRTARANANAQAVLVHIQELRREGAGSLAEISRGLEARGVCAPLGGRRWARAQVARLLARTEPTADATKARPPTPPRERTAPSAAPLSAPPETEG